MHYTQPLSGCTNGAQRRQGESNFLPCFSQLAHNVILQKVFHGLQEGQIHSLKHQSLTMNGNIVSSTSVSFSNLMFSFSTVASSVFSQNDSSGQFEFNEITWIEVLTALGKLTTRKSVGLDLLSNELLKLGACSAVCSSLATLFNLSLSQGSFPAIWQRNNNTSSQSGQERFPTQSNQPVALLSCLSKVLEQFVPGQLSSFLLESKALPDGQFGFLRGRSAEQQLLSVVERWHKALNQTHLVHTVFLDADKAFDRVDRRLLLHSFYLLGVRGVPLQ